LEQRNWIQLPARRCLPCSRMRHKQVLCLEHDTQPLLGVLADVVPLRVEELSAQPEGRPVFESLLHQYHYLSHTGTVGLYAPMRIMHSWRTPFHSRAHDTGAAPYKRPRVTLHNQRLSRKCSSSSSG
jgi:hypothetical protein